MSPHDAHARTEPVELDPCASATSTNMWHYVPSASLDFHKCTNWRHTRYSLQNSMVRLHSNNSTYFRGKVRIGGIVIDSLRPEHLQNCWKLRGKMMIKPYSIIVLFKCNILRLRLTSVKQDYKYMAINEHNMDYMD